MAMELFWRRRTRVRMHSENEPDRNLCNTCIHRKEIRNDRGSLFIMCMRSFREPEYPKYPRLPVVSCPGYENHA